MVEHGTAISADYFPAELYGDFAMEAETGHTSSSRILVDRSKENPSHSSMIRLFFP
jgi:hypothetical protein